MKISLRHDPAERMLLALLIGFAIAIVLLGYSRYRQQWKNAQHTARDQLQTIANLKVDQIVR